MQWFVTSAAAASCVKMPIAGRACAGDAPVGWHSYTLPPAHSSQLNHVPHGIGPPAQLPIVPVRLEPAATMLPEASNRMYPTPPGTDSLLLTYDQPPPASAKHAPPSGAGCQT